MTESELRQKCALAAAQWLGTKEGSDGHREILAAYNAIRPLPRGYVVKQSDPWCAAFASSCAVQAGVGELLPLECSCSKIIEKARDMEIWVEDDSYVPGIGDWILYNWEAKDTADDTGKPDHVGVVLGVENGEILVAEGNYNNAVGLRKVPVNGRYIRGFVCPGFLDAPQVRTGFHALDEIPEYARPTVEKLLSDGSLKGVGAEDLGLTEEMVRILVILDRRGVL